MVTDEPIIEEPAHAEKVSTGNERDISYWCNRFCVSRVLLMEVLAEVGPEVADVENLLRFRDI